MWHTRVRIIPPAKEIRRRLVALVIPISLLTFFAVLVVYRTSLKCLSSEIRVHTNPDVLVDNIYYDVSNTDLENSPMLSPWHKLPKFQIYLRMSSHARFVNEYRNWFLKSYKYFYPPELAESTLVIGMDKERKRDHIVGKTLGSTWPYPKLCFLKPDNVVYQGNQRFRMFWDQFHPEKCIKEEYVAFVDSDTVFTSLVTPSTLFRNNKPIVNAHVGPPNFKCWPEITEYWLGHKEAIQCMSYFPVIIKVAHVIELRKYISKRFNKRFDDVYRDGNNYIYECTCQFSVMCNYVWYYHRDEYFFRLQMGPSNWNGKDGFSIGMASLEYLLDEDEVPSKYWTPTPRIAIHGRYIYDEEMGTFMSKRKQRNELKRILKQGLCYSAGFEYCPEYCNEFNKTGVYEYIYNFEYWSWTWDKRCLDIQRHYYAEVKSVLSYYEKKDLPLFGAKNKEEFCNLLDDGNYV